MKNPKSKPKKKIKKAGAKTSSPYDTFFLAFVGEFVEIVGRLSDENSEESIKTIGYILDYNKEWIFLGHTPDEISHCVKRHRVTLINTLNPDNMYMEMLDEMEIPKNEQGKN